MIQTKESIYSTVEDLRDLIIQVNDYIHDNPELGHQEFKAVELLTSTLADHGFQVEKEVAGLPTAFTATYQNKQGGPVIGLLCEYDALEGLGHGCGHNLQASSITGAAIALRNNLGELPARIIVYGTPAEETTSGKVPMAEAGLFDCLDVALMMHGGDRTTVDGKSLAINSVEFVFEGKASHAAVAPEQGISALDAVLLTFNGIEYLREHVRSDVKIHGIITDGGTAPNIVPERAEAKFLIRAADRAYLDTVVERVYNVARGAALAVGAKLTIHEGKALDNKLNVQRLNDLLLENARLAGAREITPPRQSTGSTDFSTVTHRVPGACLRVSFVPFGVSNHTRDWVEAGKSEDGHAAIIAAAKAIAATSYDLITKPDVLKEIQKEFLVAKGSRLP
ncbi:amidohydrolase [Brevibacillus reuszeri]|uniref:Peptidase M20 domain-containing protein 2 n=1 Tax=Brevibacillus reuszeri TaxID=54915 RepID=A0A0K9YRZ8_9BACL|nr:M20 family metallopeptidase [Brevibacillus reuszeri]KNB71498.1 amidohydrolase [Brevibacillus reuszeri]MED1855703.1 M20 family metallopeptidase [Brevibacillus reuszeri]GED67147.1 amidohydrolase [Brevibacillus reuszeri]